MTGPDPELIARLLEQRTGEGSIDLNRPEQVCGECGGSLNQGHVRDGYNRRCPDTLDP